MRLTAAILMLFLGVEAMAHETSSAKVSAEHMKAWEKLGEDRKSTRLNSSHIQKSRMPSSA